MNDNVRTMLLIAAISGFVSATPGCKKADDAGRDALSSGSSGVMSNSAGPGGTPGTSAAAKSASVAATASAPSPVTSEAPVVSTPDATASGASSAQ